MSVDNVASTAAAVIWSDGSPGDNELSFLGLHDLGVDTTTGHLIMARGQGLDGEPLRLSLETRPRGLCRVLLHAPQAREHGVPPRPRGRDETALVLVQDELFEPLWAFADQLDVDADRHSLA